MPKTSRSERPRASRHDPAVFADPPGPADPAAVGDPVEWSPSQAASPAGPKPNRVTPLGDIVATEQRGAWLGNRGILHRGTEVVRFHASNLWIICELQFKDWRLPQWQPHHLTVLFFHDEAVALAAGHRPCALCRRPSYNAYRQSWAAGLGTAVPLAKEIDRQLHGERIVPGTHRRRLHDTDWADVPAGAFVWVDGQPALVTEQAVVPWTTAGYQGSLGRPRAGHVAMITPPSTAAALRAGYRPQVDGSAGV